MNGSNCQRGQPKHFQLASFHDYGNTDSTEMCCRQSKMPVPLWEILISGMRPCGWHGTTKVVIPFHPSPIFHPAPFVFHLEKQNCSPFSSCKNMASQKALREVSITGMAVLWLPQHTVSWTCWEKENTGHQSYGTIDNTRCCEAQTENLIWDRIESIHICAATLYPTMHVHGFG